MDGIENFQLKFFFNTYQVTHIKSFNHLTAP